jgi:hypothetical protein
MKFQSLPNIREAVTDGISWVNAVPSKNSQAQFGEPLDSEAELGAIGNILQMVDFFACRSNATCRN